VGYYTGVAGLGASPTDVTINGHVDVYNRCLTPDNCIALNNFWRSLSNLTINVKGLSDCRASGDFWAVSQAAPMRRVNITGGNLTLMDYCTAGPQYASGGFIAKPTDSAQTINVALARGQNLIFTPGIYQVDKTIKVKRADTVVLGLGFPTLVPSDGVIPMTVADVTGVKLAGLMFDAGPVNSPVLLQVGTPHAHKSDPTNPTSLQDVFLRIGGATPGKATTSLVVNSDNVLLDNIWAWRADHGNGVGWTSNTADTGVIVNGDNVTAYGLFVEHYQKYQLIWNGENGKTIFFQNEMPYDPPNQAAWTHDGVNGYAAYKVADSVETHEAWGLGSYCFFNVGPSIHAARGFEVPDTSGVKLHDILTVFLNGFGGIDHVVNDTGAAVNATNQVVNVVNYP
jgi:hypothetical protein